MPTDNHKAESKTTGTPERIVVGFVRLLRGAGVAVAPGEAITFARALGEVGWEREDAVYWAGRATLVRRPEDVAAYDTAFAAYWKGATPTGRNARPQQIDLVLDDDQNGEEDAAQGDHDEQRPALVVRYSATEALRHRDFSAYTTEEWAEARRLISQLRLAVEVRRSRRYRPSKRRRGRPDVGRTVRKALASDGEPVRRAYREASQRPRRLVVLVDISGSMEPYGRALMRFAHAAVCARDTGSVEVFTLGTRLTRVTRPLSWRDPDAALTQASATVEDWSGGTRLGSALAEFATRWGRKGLARGAVVVILSDGWDRGEPEQLAGAMAQLQRVAHRVVWVNPLKASPGYQPLARGMAAALPYVDNFVEGHSLDSLERLAGLLSSYRTPDRQPVRMGQ